MQTFLPYPDFARTASVLDYRRLGKQRVEAMQLLDPPRAWENHPAHRMWSGFKPALAQYLRAVILEWINRGYRNTMEIPRFQMCEMPTWLGNFAFHAAHRSNLLRKFPDHYRKFGWNVPNNLPYIWPKDSTQ